jgi:glycerol-3-phosphate acyltransferase PlsX
MGGDYAPGEIVKGAVSAAEQGGVEVALAGPTDTLEMELAKYNISHLPVRCVAASEVITEDEHPALAIRHKPDASVAVVARMVKIGDADAMVSAGSTGAMATSAVLFIGTIEGVERPAVGGPITGFAPNTILMDCGANVDCKPYQLLSFAVMGCVYAERLLNIANPAVGLLSSGSEEGKGNELVRETFPLLQKSGLNFIGNMEGSDVLSGRANVIVCDGFVGNILLKFYESMGDYAGDAIRKKLKGNPLLRHAGKILDEFISLTKVTEGESMGGGLLWGIDGIAFAMHGNSRAPQVARTIMRAKEAVKIDLVNSIKSELARVIGE